MVQGVSSGSQVGIVAMTALRYAQAGGPSVVLPVRRAEMLYANFRHIQVRPDTRMEAGIPLYKLKILDTLIASFARGAGGSATAARGGDLAGKRLAPSVDTIDKMIAAAAKNLRADGSGSAAYRAGFLPAPGAFVDLAA
ncbi:MAG: hypothetical protein ABSG63_10850 [Spirochaetia bacterium]